MELESIFFARYAEIGPDGLFTAVGAGLNRIDAGGFPWAWGFLFLLARVRLTIEEGQGQHVTAVERETPTGQVEPIIGSESSMMRVPPWAALGPDGKVGIAFNVCLAQLMFPVPGVYKYRFKIDGQEVGVAQLLVAGPPQGEQKNHDPDRSGH
jgi:hypothetical protein